MWPSERRQPGVPQTRGSLGGDGDGWSAVEADGGGAADDDATARRSLRLTDAVLALLTRDSASVSSSKHCSVCTVSYTHLTLPTICSV